MRDHCDETITTMQVNTQSKRSNQALIKDPELIALLGPSHNEM